MTVLVEEKQMELPLTVLLQLARDKRYHRSARLKSRFPRVRGDSLPEVTRYRDDGCDVYPECLTCPLPRCRYEEPGGLKGMLNGMRDKEIVAMKMRGITVEDIADQFGVSRRTVFRVLTERYKEARCA